MLAGVDGCKGGWVLVAEDQAGARTIQRVPTIGDIIAADGIELAIVDIPIGLMDDQPRAADREARRFLGARGCCVFPAPYRSVVRASTYPEACALRERIDGKRMSQQAFGILAKIREVDSTISPDLQSRVREGHPEVTFAVLEGGTAVPTPKKTRSGQEQRRSLLQAHFPELAEMERKSLPKGASMDDLLDAYAMLWTARRVRQGVHLTLPSAPQFDSRGLRAEIVA